MDSWVFVTADKKMSWQPILANDIDLINRLADSVHKTLPERPEVFLDKITLFPDGCRKLVWNGVLEGYGISHPWRLNQIPPLDSFLGSLPESAECIYLHDVAISPRTRGKQASSFYLDYIKGLAKRSNIRYLACVSVYGTDVLWSRYGFGIVKSSSLEEKLSTYGSTAKYMVCDLSSGDK